MNEREYYINYMEEIHVSESAKAHLWEQVKEREKREAVEVNNGIFKLWQNGARNKKVAVAWMVVFLFVTAFFVVPSPVKTYAEYYCELVVYRINDMIYGEHEDVTNYTTEIVQAQKDGDLALQLNEILIDGDHFILNYTVTCDEPRFYYHEEGNLGTYENYYDIGIEEITINGKSHKYDEDEIWYGGFVEESADQYTYPVDVEQCMHEFADELANPDAPLIIRMKVIAKCWENEDGEEDKRYFNYAFTVSNRQLQLETKEIPLNRTVQMDNPQDKSGQAEKITLQLEKLAINSHSQRIYFYVEGVPDFSFCNTTGPDDHRYEFGIKGYDENGNKVYGGVQEIIDGYGYFELRDYGDSGLRSDVAYYDLQLDYSWIDSKYDVVDDSQEHIDYHVYGNLGEVFRVECK